MATVAPVLAETEIISVPNMSNMVRINKQKFYTRERAFVLTIEPSIMKDLENLKDLLFDEKNYPQYQKYADYFEHTYRDLKAMADEISHISTELNVDTCYVDTEILIELLNIFKKRSKRGIPEDQGSILAGMFKKTFNNENLSGTNKYTKLNSVYFQAIASNSIGAHFLYI